MLSLCPGQNKILSRFPFVLGQTPLSRDVLGQNELKNFKKMTRFPVFEHNFPVLEHHFPVLEHHSPGLEHLFLF